MGFIARENHGIETINMQFKFKLCLIIVCNSIINMGSLVMWYQVKWINLLKKKKKKKIQVNQDVVF